MSDKRLVRPEDKEELSYSEELNQLREMDNGIATHARLVHLAETLMYELMETGAKVSVLENALEMSQSMQQHLLEELTKALKK